MLKPSLLITIATLAVAAVLGAAPPASAKTPCWQVVISDWYENGRIDKTYPIPCYAQAIHPSLVIPMHYFGQAVLDRFQDKTGPTVVEVAEAVGS